MALSDLRPHPQNYRRHPPEQLRQLEASLRTHGCVRNVVVARDGTILCGHGIVEAARRLGLEALPVVQMPLDPAEPRALQLLVAENEIARLADVDDRALTDMLRGLGEIDPALLEGTGFDAQQLAMLVYQTRPAGEIPDRPAAIAWVGEAAAEWAAAGNGEHVTVPKPCKLVLSFRSLDDRIRCMEVLDLRRAQKCVGTAGAWSAWWPLEIGDAGSS